MNANKNNHQSENYKELLLSVDLKSWQVNNIAHGTIYNRELKEKDPSKIELFKKVLEKYNYTCYYCGFQSNELQEVHHFNGDHDDYSPSNLTCVCPLCHQSHHLNSAYIHNGAELIWLPELTQQELNHLCRALFVANQIREESGSKNNHFILDNGFSYIWQNILYSRKKILNTKFGDGASDLGKFAQVLLDIKETQPNLYKNRANWIKGFKLLHNPNRFILQTQHWKNHNFKNIQVHNWIKLAKKLEINLPETNKEDTNQPMF